MYRKDPDETLDYMVDWTEVLTAEDPDDTITTATWTVPPGIVKASDPGPVVRAGRTLHIVWLSGGTTGFTYRVTSRIVTTGGRTHERTLPVYVATR